MRRAIVSGLVLFGLANTVGCRGWESEEPPVHLVKNMDTQRKGKAYRRDPSGLFEDGRVMREPVEGTVAFGSLPPNDVYLTGLGEDTQPTLKYPEGFTKSDATVARGELRFQIYCSPCHGRQLDGKGTVSTRGLVVPPPSMYDPRIKTMPVGKIYSAIAHGVNNGNMPSYAAQIPTEDRWAIVSYIRSAQMKEDPSVNEEGGANVVVAKASKASLAHGEQLFTAKACVTCHSLDGTRKVGPSFKGLWGKTETTDKGDVKVDEAYITESLATPMAKVVAGYPPAMPPMQLDPIELQSLILFIQAQK